MPFVGTLRDDELRELQEANRVSAAGGADGTPYRLPEHLRERVEQQYRRDVTAMHGPDEPSAGQLESEYNSFISELGGGNGGPSGTPNGRTEGAGR